MDISICYEKLTEFADKIHLNEMGFNTWDSDQFINTTDEEILAQYFFVGNAINFKFWYDIYNNRFKYKNYTGSASMWAVLRDNPQYLDAKYLEKFTIEEEPNILSMPMAFEREKALREVGEVLTRMYGGKIITLCNNCNWDALAIIKEITQNFPMWNDEYKSVAFHKRTKLFVAMLHGRLAEKSRLSNVEKFSCLADYQMPKVLEHFGVLQYPAYIKEAISRQFIFSSGSNEEFQIRVQTLAAVKMICDYLSSKKINVCPLELDYYIWSMSHLIDEPHHLTVTTAY